MAKVNYVIYAGLAAGVLVMAAAIVLATANQQANMSDTLVPSRANLEGPIPSESGWGPVINKEQWHADPLGDIATEVVANAGQ